MAIPREIKEKAYAFFLGGVKMVNKLCLEMLYCTCMKSPYRDDKKAKAMATLSVYNIKAKNREENRKLRQLLKLT